MARVATETCPIEWGDERDHRRKIALAVNDLFEGSTNAIVDVTLTPDATETVIFDSRVKAGMTYVTLIARSATGAAAITSTWAESFIDGELTLHHSSDPATDRRLGVELRN